MAVKCWNQQFSNIEGEMRQYKDAMINAYGQITLVCHDGRIGRLGSEGLPRMEGARTVQVVEATVGSAGRAETNLLEKYLNTSGGRWGSTATRLQNDSSLQRSKRPAGR